MQLVENDGCDGSTLSPLESHETTPDNFWDDSSESSSSNSSNSKSTGGSESDSESTTNSNNQFGGPIVEESVAEEGESTNSNPRKESNASSSSSAAQNDSEMLFPFVCQSRFANEFVELSTLGKGGFGQVMLAENRLDGRKYAIKRVGLHLKNQTSKTLQKFLREVKILALLDHPNIVRYYQAWLEKVEEGELGAASASASSTSSAAPPRNYSMSNLLAPISEMDFSEPGQKSMGQFYSNGSFMDDDGGFEWERNSSDGSNAEQGWKDEDLFVPSARPVKREARSGKQDVSVEEDSSTQPNANKRRRGAGKLDDTSAYSADQCDHWLYIQMQYCAGRNLGDYLAVPSRPMHLSKLMKIFNQIASAIAHVHSCGLIHRDLKPANIFVADTDGDSIKLGDFGLSRYAANVNLSTQSASIDEQTMNIASNGHMMMMSMSKWSASVSHMSESNEITAGVGTYLYASPGTSRRQEVQRQDRHVLAGDDPLRALSRALHDDHGALHCASSRA
ncbi:hypothetical protein PINS_up011061 [Pythium insidiosum]|nr:hypothetical protein PINS_up011061 [Pythium insidiosum]